MRRLTRSAARAARFSLLLALVVASLAGVAGRGRAQDAPFEAVDFGVDFELLVDGLEQPVQLVDLDDGSGRMLVVQQGGLVRILRDGALDETPFLDVSGQISTGSEQGLLGLAPHPGFAENGTFFIDYTDTDGNTRVERWTTDSADADRADPASAQPVLFQEQPYPNHNGGLLLFGPDGYLYVGLGDGGSGGDPLGHGQNPETLLGSILRIDVDNLAEGQGYGIPDDNPFVDQAGAAPEIWAYGLRNPWRFSFDRETGDLLIGDVGQGEVEEVDFQPAGAGGLNFGWNLKEGPECYASDTCDDSDLVDPFFWYTHDEGGCSVTGGYVYRGEAVPELSGVYLTGDYCSGQLWGVGRDAEGAWQASEPIETGYRISSFAEDASGEVYLIDHSGAIYRIVGA